MARSFFTDRAASIRASLGKAESALAEAEALARAAEARKAALESEIARIKAEFDAQTDYQLARIHEIAKAHSARLKHDSQMTAAATTRSCSAPGARAAGRGRRYASREIDRAQLRRPTTRAGCIEGFMDKLGQEGRRCAGSRVAKRYARALLDLAERGQLENLGRRTRTAGRDGRVARDDRAPESPEISEPARPRRWRKSKRSSKSVSRCARSRS